MVPVMKTVLPKLLGGDPEKEMECAIDRIYFQGVPCKTLTISIQCPKSLPVQIASCISVIVLQYRWRQDGV